MLSLTIDIPALDRLCDWLESGNRAAMMEEIKAEIVAKLKEAAEERGQATGNRQQVETVKATETVQTSETAKATEAKPITLDQVQRAAAQMRDDGKLKAVTDMFPEFGIKKLSDLKGDQLQTFGERLRAMGARI